MSRTKPPNPDFLNGIPELLILQVLAAKPMHGYEVVRAIKAASQDRFDFGEGCIYPILHRLERDGMLAATREMAGNRPRIVYRVTPEGQSRFQQSLANWSAVVQAVNAVLQGGSDVQPSLA